MSRIERLGRSIARAACLLGVAGGLIVSIIAVRDGFTLSERVTRDLGAWGWALFAMVVAGGAIQCVAMYKLVRGQAGTWANVRAGVILLVVTVITYIALFPRSDGLSVELFLGAWAGGFGAVVLAAARTPNKRPSRAMLWVFQVCVVLLLLEGGLRVLSHVAPSALLVAQEGSVMQKLEAHSVTPGYVHFGFPHNSDGFYDQEFLPPSQRTSPMVAVIGDSFSLSLVPHRAHYTTVCERELGDTDVYNIGVGACGPEEYRQLMLTEALPLNPGAIVVSVFVGNDLLDLKLHTAGKWTRSWFDRGNCRVSLVFSRVSKITLERARGGVQWSQRSNDLLETEAELVDAFPWYANPMLDPGNFSPAAYSEIVRSRIPPACNPDPVRVRAMLEVLRSMRDLADRPFAVVLIPAEFQVEDSVWQQALAGMEPGDYDRDQPQRSIRDGLKKLGIPVLDLLPALRDAKPFEDGDRHLYRLRDTHFGVLGNKIAGEELAPFVRTLLR